jgi:predicted ester cyclase
MSTETNKDLIRRYLEAIRQDKSPATLDKFIEEDDLKQHIAIFEQVLPGYYIDVEGMLAEGDQVAVRGMVHGIHKGEFMGIAPTEKQVSFPLMITYRIANNKIVEHWMLADMMAFMQQLGAVPDPAHA